MHKTLTLSLAAALAATISAAVKADSSASTTGDWIQVGPPAKVVSTIPEPPPRPRTIIGLVPTQPLDGPPAPNANTEGRMTTQGHPLAPPPPAALEAGNSAANDAVESAQGNGETPDGRRPRIIVVSPQNAALLPPGAGPGPGTYVIPAEDTSTPSNANIDHTGDAVSNTGGITRAGIGSGNSPVVGRPNLGTGDARAQANDPNGANTVSNTGGVSRAQIGIGETQARRGAWDAPDYVPANDGGAGGGNYNGVVTNTGGITRSGTGYGNVYGGGSGGAGADPNGPGVVSNSAGLTRAGQGSGNSPVVGRGNFGLGSGLNGSTNRGR